MTNDFDNLDEFKDLIDEVKAAGEVPEPSPLFWNHLSARVRDAVAAEPLPVAWWRSAWRPLTALVGVLGVVIMAVLLRPTSGPARAGLPVAVEAPDATAADAAMSEETEAMWDMISALAPSIPVDEAVAAGMEPGRGATEAAIEALTDAERRELVKLLRAEIGSSE